MASEFRKSLARLRGVPAPAAEPPISRPDQLPLPAITAAAPTLRSRAEADVCDALAHWLRGLGWQVFFEVPLGRGRPDVVGVRDPETIAIEAKLADVAGVVKQGLRLTRFTAQAYLALPPTSAGEAGVLLEKISLSQPTRPLPGILIVSRTVRELRQPKGAPRAPISAAELRQLGLTHGASRGGTPGGDRIERNERLWLSAAVNPDIEALTREFAMPAANIRAVLLRLRVARTHLAECSLGPACSGGPALQNAHRHVDVLAGLPELPDAIWRQIERRTR